MFYPLVMVVYIEYVLADNLFMDWLLLSLSAKTVKFKARPLRLWLSAILGSVGAVAVSLITISFWGILAKTALFIAMSALAFAHKNLKKTFFLALAFAVFTFLAGGIIIGLFYLFKVDFFNGATLSCFTRIPVGLFLLGLLSFVGLVKGIVAEGKKQRALKTFGCRVSFLLFGKKWEMQGIFDSGNSLTSNDGLPVCFLCNGCLSQRLKKAVAQRVADGAPPQKLQYVSFATVQGNSKTIAFQAEQFFVDGVAKECLIAFGNARGNGFEMLVNLYLLENAV